MEKIDGAYGEGGGQILRTAVVLSVISGRPVEIFNIRKGRKKPGLMPQHLTGIRAAAEICGASLEGASFGSQELRFLPGEIKSGDYSFDVAEKRGSAGAATLVLQSIVPVLIRNGKSKVVIKGGTHVPFSPPFDYTEAVLFQTLRRFLKLNIKGKLLRYGFYPVGGGEVEVEVEFLGWGDNIERVEFIERGRILKKRGISLCANLPRHIAERQAKRFLELTGIVCEVRTARASCAGTYIFANIEFENVIAGFSCLGERGKLAEKVAEEAVEDYLSYIRSSGATDPWLADQLPIFSVVLGIPFLYTTTKITKHLLTNQWVINTFFQKEVVTIKEREGEEGKIEVNPLKCS